jgi:N4-(beta-N-acetylglucosaminyl)-L-asparaginase
MCCLGCFKIMGKLDAVEAGVKFRSWSKERSVGYGGRPDRDGRVTLDACIMDENANIDLWRV